MKKLLLLPLIILFVACFNNEKKDEKIVNDDSKIEKNNVLNNTPYYSNSLEKDNLKFHIQAYQNRLVIKIDGLKHEKEDIIEEIFAKVTNSQITDINNDGEPELYIYLSREENGKKYAELMAYNINKKHSLSDIFVEPLESNKEVLNGFLGNDIFKIENNKLLRSFPLEKGIKTVQYKLQEKNSFWQLKIDKIIE